MTEAIIEPELPICDPHHHLWDRDGSRYMLKELEEDTGGGHRVEHTVFVECGSGYRPDGPEAFRPVGETEFVVEADPDGFIAGIVGFVDLRSPETADVLAAHVEAGRGRFRGSRSRPSGPASPPWGAPGSASTPGSTTPRYPS
jgi:L-fuconolactonase